MTAGITRRELLGSAVAAAGAASFRPHPVAASAAPFDLVIRGGRIVDGTGGPPFEADLGIAGDSIRAVGAIGADQGREVLDARGLCVAPGFIDIHTHSDRTVLEYPNAESRILQGITTEVTGNCGSSAAPRCGDDDQATRPTSSASWPSRPAWTDVLSYLRRLADERIAVNHALLLGQGTLRACVAGLADRPLTGAELATVLRGLEDGLDQGAAGLSSGLEYIPGRYTPPEELVLMARVVARAGKLYASHIRNEEAGLLEAIGEALSVGRESGVRVEISHLKASGRRNWDKQGAALELIEGARKQGIDVLADAYPYTAYATTLTIFLEDWAREGGRPAILARLKDAETRARIRRAVPARVEADPGGFSLVVISSVGADRNKSAIGKSLEQIADGWKMDPTDALLRLLEEEDGAASFVGHGMSPKNVERVLAHPLVMIGSDGVCLAPRGAALEDRPHPRSYGTCANVLARARGPGAILTLESAVRKMTSMPADHLGVRNRGRIGRGMKADVVVFDAAAVRDEATFEDPHRHPSGIRHVVVNGAAVVNDGRVTGKRPGSLLT